MGVCTCVRTGRTDTLGGRAGAGGLYMLRARVGILHGLILNVSFTAAKSARIPNGVCGSKV